MKKTILITLLILLISSCKKETPSTCSTILKIEEVNETRLEMNNGFTYPVTNHYFLVHTTTKTIETKSINGLSVGKTICN